jgi:anaerobic ribonucleoside-triphosphate reductase activating protein
MGCAGCISPDTWERGRGATQVSDIVNLLRAWAGEADGLTVSGGEPFEQSETLAQLLRAWRSLSRKSVLVFTGYEFDQVQPWLGQHSGLIDALMTGPFIEGAPQTKSMRGSDNQALHLLTPLGETELLICDRAMGRQEKRLDVLFDEDGGVWFAGIPLRRDIERLRKALRDAGHTVTSNSRAAHP